MRRKEEANRFAILTLGVTRPSKSQRAAPIHVSAHRQRSPPRPHFDNFSPALQFKSNRCSFLRADPRVSSAAAFRRYFRLPPPNPASLLTLSVAAAGQN
jgi:hypothetical protein